MTLAKNSEPNQEVPLNLRPPCPLETLLPLRPVDDSHVLPGAPRLSPVAQVTHLGHVQVKVGVHP